METIDALSRNSIDFSLCQRVASVRLGWMGRRIASRPRWHGCAATSCAGLESLFGPRRRPDEPPDLARFADVAAGLQRQTEEAVLALARRLARATGERNLCFAGGVALNCVANARLESQGPFDAVFVPGAAHDAGTAFGAALDIAQQSNDSPEPNESRRGRADTVSGPGVH